MLIIQLKHLYHMVPFKRFLILAHLLLLNWKRIRSGYTLQRSYLPALTPAPTFDVNDRDVYRTFENWMVLAKENVNRHYKVMKAWKGSVTVPTSESDDLVLVTHDFGYMAFAMAELHRKQEMIALVEKCYLDSLNAKGIIVNRWHVAPLSPIYP